jgi:SAM-dependent methyltransferase
MRNMFDDRYGAPGLYTIYKCEECGFGRTKPELKKTQIGSFYRKYYPLSKTNAKEVRESAYDLPYFLSWIWGLNNSAHKYIKKTSNVLDIGSGSGVSLLEIKKMGAKGFGVEPDPNAQNLARDLGIKVFPGFITDNPFPGMKFDYVTASQVLEHEPDPINFLTSAKKKLNPGGQIILGFPNLDSFYRKYFDREWLNWHIPYHINFFSKKSVIKLASKAGLKIKKYKTVTPNIWTVFQMRKLFDRVSVGKKSLLWSAEGQTLLSKFITAFLFVAVTPLNRLLDVFGVGDCALLVLENEK